MDLAILQQIHDPDDAVRKLNLLPTTIYLWISVGLERTPHIKIYQENIAFTLHTSSKSPLFWLENNTKQNNALCKNPVNLFGEK